jgi:hypothetical protein
MSWELVTANKSSLNCLLGMTSKLQHILSWFDLWSFVFCSSDNPLDILCIYILDSWLLFITSSSWCGFTRYFQLLPVVNLNKKIVVKQFVLQRQDVCPSLSPYEASRGVSTRLWRLIWTKFGLNRGGDALGNAGVSLQYIAAGPVLWFLVVYIKAMCHCLSRL